MEQKKYESVHYHQYLELDKILDAQHPRSEALGAPAHDEMLFIITHQVHELWFKEILHNLYSAYTMFLSNSVDERNISKAVLRLERVNEIMKLLVDQVRVLETMTPLDFLDFRNFLLPASGFQSFQFRKIETLLGLKRGQRITYNQKDYTGPFTDKERDELNAIENDKSLLEIIETWLERTPFLEFGSFNFLEKYHLATERMIENEKIAIIESDYIAEEQKKIRLKMLDDTATYFESVLNKSAHLELVKKGEAKLSYKAKLAALLINLYRDEPILQMPYRLLATVTELDELITLWRYRHAQMVLRMLGKKIGTGGSSGHKYLSQTAEQHHIFSDLQNISTLLIPRSDLPELPEHLTQELGFYFSSNKQ